MKNPTVKVIEAVDELTGAHVFEWKFEATITVSDVWVQDGYELTQARLQDMLDNALGSDLGYATSTEATVTGVKITRAPNPLSVLAAMGYPVNTTT